VQDQYVIILDSLPSQAALSDTQKLQVMQFMATQSDIFWIDNMVGMLSNAAPSTTASNIYESSWGDDPTKDYLAQIWGEKYLWWFTALNGGVKTQAAASDPTNQVPQSIREKWLNIQPYNSDHYPVIISQWNEYAEYLI